MPSKCGKDSPIVAIDLFCGAGGLTCGLELGGIRVAAGIDLDPACAAPFESNHPNAQFIQRDITKVDGALLRELWGDAEVRLLAGCAPCQPFSTYSQGKNHEEDDRWNLLRDFARLVSEAKPDFVTMENVPSLKGTAPYKAFTNLLRQAGYKVWSKVLDCTRLGLPQKRRRLILTAALNGPAPKLNLQTASKRKNVRDLLKDLPSLAAGGQDLNDPLHRSAKLKPINLKRIRASKPGGSWLDWPVSLRTKCHKKKSGDGYTAVYGRMSWKTPAPTITTQCYNYGSGRFGHPSQDRAISLREASLLQGFPANYIFEAHEKPATTRDIARLIGNAVPPPVGIALAKAFLHSRLPCQNLTNKR